MLRIDELHRVGFGEEPAQAAGFLHPWFLQVPSRTQRPTSRTKTLSAPRMNRNPAPLPRSTASRGSLLTRSLATYIQDRDFGFPAQKELKGEEPEVQDFRQLIRGTFLEEVPSGRHQERGSGALATAGLISARAPGGNRQGGRRL